MVLDPSNLTSSINEHRDVLLTLAPTAMTSDDQPGLSDSSTEGDNRWVSGSTPVNICTAEDPAGGSLNFSVQVRCEFFP